MGTLCEEVIIGSIAGQMELVTGPFLPDTPYFYPGGSGSIRSLLPCPVSPLSLSELLRLTIHSTGFVTRLTNRKLCIPH
jgi:hypothetical protein